MDLQDLKHRALAARRHWRDCAGFRLQIERPTESGWRGLEDGARESLDGAVGVVEGRIAERIFCEAARRWVCDWEGVTFAGLFPAEDLTDEERATPAPCEPDLAAILVQEWPEVGEALFGHAQALYQERKAEEAEAKKKPSNGSASPAASASSAEPAS